MRDEEDKEEKDDDDEDANVGERRRGKIREIYGRRIREGRKRRGLEKRN